MQKQQLSWFRKSLVLAVVFYSVSMVLWIMTVPPESFEHYHQVFGISFIGTAILIAVMYIKYWK